MLFYALLLWLFIVIDKNVQTKTKQELRFWETAKTLHFGAM